ncbi:ALP1-like protein [Tanacetum coccineum]
MKCTSAIRQLTYGTVPDALDKYLHMGEATSRLSLEHFCRSIIPIFGPEFLEKPTITDIESDLKVGISLEIPFVANDVTYPWGYYLCDRIYPEWVPFVKSVTNLSDDDHKRLRYKAMHEAAKKDVERVFGVLKKKCVILATPARAYIKGKLANIMYTCIILHNMIIKDRKEAICPEWYPEEEHQSDDLIRADEQRHRIIRYIKSSKAHQMLKADLIEHVNRNV